MEETKAIATTSTAMVRGTTHSSIQCKDYQTERANEKKKLEDELKTSIPEDALFVRIIDLEGDTTPLFFACNTTIKSLKKFIFNRFMCTCCCKLEGLEIKIRHVDGTPRQGLTDGCTVLFRMRDKHQHVQPLYTEPAQ